MLELVFRILDGIVLEWPAQAISCPLQQIAILSGLAQSELAWYVYPSGELYLPNAM